MNNSRTYTIDMFMMMMTTTMTKLLLLQLARQVKTKQIFLFYGRKKTYTQGTVTLSNDILQYSPSYIH